MASAPNAFSIQPLIVYLCKCIIDCEAEHSDLPVALRSDLQLTSGIQY